MLYLVFLVKKSKFAIPIDSVERIVEQSQNIKEIPTEFNFLNGLYNYQGRVITIFDISDLLGFKDFSDKNFIILSKNITNAGYVVNDIIGFKEISEDISDQVVLADRRFIKGVVSGNDNEPITIIDIENLENDLINPKKWGKSDEK